MPNTSAGIQAPASALLLAAPASTMPSTWPVPNFSGSFENFLRHRVGHPRRHVGARAGLRCRSTVPSALPRSSGQRVLHQQAPHALEARCRSSRCADLRAAGRCAATKRRISETANMPTIIGIRLTPPVELRVAEGEARMAGRVVEADAGDTSKPEQQRHASPSAMLALPMNTAPASPSTTIQKYSNVAELERDLRRARARRVIMHRGAEQPADARRTPGPRRARPRPGPSCVIA